MGSGNKRFKGIKTASPFAQMLIGEALGTFFLTVVTVCAIKYAPGLAALAIGFALTALVFTYGYVSKGQYNPVVSFALFVSGAQELKPTIAVILTQLIFGLGGAFVGAALLPDRDDYPALAPKWGFVKWDDHGDIGRMFLAEAIFTFNLAHTFLNVAASRQGGNHFFGLATGMSVLAAGYAAGNICGISFNTSVTTGMQLTHAILGTHVPDNATRPIEFLWVYWLADLLGSLFAGLVFHFVHDGDEPDTGYGAI